MTNNYKHKWSFTFSLLAVLAPLAAAGQIPTPPANVQNPDVAAFVNAHSATSAPYTGTVNVSVPLSCRWVR